MAVGVVAVMVAAAVALLRAIVIGRASRKWPSVQGRVEALEVVTRQRSPGTDTYRPVITYRYTVRGREYVGRRIRMSNWLAMGMEHWTQAEARGVLDGYYPGAPATVYFDPESPRHSLLRPGVPRPLYFAAVLLVVLGTAVTAALWIAFFGQGVLAT